MIGMIKSDNRNIPIMLMLATTPNSFNKELSVRMKVANPEAVVTLVIKVAFPTLVITRCSAFALLPCFLYSCWYLLIRNIQLGIPITIIRGGISAVNTVISYFNNPKNPNAHITPMITVIIEMNVALYDLKKKKKSISNMRLSEDLILNEK